MNRKIKQPISVLVILHDGEGNVLLLERADRAGFWQSVTGSVEIGETLLQTAMREVQEETGISLMPSEIQDWQSSTVYEIYPHWRHRYADGVTENTEHLFSAQISRHQLIRLAENEHTVYCWLDAKQAAEKVFSPSNQTAILRVCLGI